MFQPLDHRFGHYLLLLAASACLFLCNLGGPALWDIDEGRNASAAEAMLESGDWVVPTFNGELRSHKPVLLYWLQVAAYEVFGINEFAARLPSALAAMLTVLLVYELCRGMFNSSTGLIGGLILASSTLFSASAHFANPDALLLTFTTATFLSLWLGTVKGRSGWFLLAGVTTGLAVLAKGPVGIVLPGAAFTLFLLWTRRWRVLWNRAWIQAWLLFGVVALPWYILVTVETKRAFINEFFFTHNLDRVLNPMEDHRGPPWYYLVVLAVGLVPWSVFLGAALWYGSWPTLRLPWCAVRRPWAGANDNEPDATNVGDAYRFVWCWIAVYLLAFTLAATKLPNYILPVFPPFALLIARFLDRWRRRVIEVPAFIQPLGLIILALIGVATVFGLLIAGGAIELPLLRGRSWPGLEQWAVLGAVPLAGAGLGAWCLYRDRRTAFVGVLVTAAAGFLAPLAAGGSVALNSFRAPGRSSNKPEHCSATRKFALVAINWNSCPA